jgi:hypothetical protein
MEEMEEHLLKNLKKSPADVDLGFILWKLETIQDFLPAYKTIMKKE